MKKIISLFIIFSLLLNVSFDPFEFGGTPLYAETQEPRPPLTRPQFGNYYVTYRTQDYINLMVVGGCVWPTSAHPPGTPGADFTPAGGAVCHALVWRELREYFAQELRDKRGLDRIADTLLPSEIAELSARLNLHLIVNRDPRCFNFQVDEQRVYTVVGENKPCADLSMLNKLDEFGRPIQPGAQGSQGQQGAQGTQGAQGQQGAQLRQARVGGGLTPGQAQVRSGEIMRAAKARATHLLDRAAAARGRAKAAKAVGNMREARRQARIARGNLKRARGVMNRAKKRAQRVCRAAGIGFNDPDAPAFDVRF